MDAPTLVPCSSSSKSLPPLMRVLTTDEDYIRVSQFVEVFSVQINKCDADERHGDLYGSIEAVDIAGSLNLYGRQRENPEDIRVNGTVSLTGPPRSISIVSGFALNVDLHLRKDGNSNGNGGDDERKDVEICRWQLSWDVMKPEVAYIARGKYLMDVLKRPDAFQTENLYYNATAGYDRPLSALLKGEDGCCATVYYAILKYAVQAAVAVDIIHLQYREGKPPPPTEYDIHGSVFGSYGHFENDLEYTNRVDIKNYCKCTFLDTAELKSVKGVCGKRLEMSRSVMAVPAYTSLVIEADLWYNDFDARPKIAKGKLEFKPLGNGFFCDYIMGDNDLAIRVTVCFSFKSYVPAHSIPF